MPKIEMVWVDLETTGLNAELEVPLEIGVVLTDRLGTVLNEESMLIYEADHLGFMRSVELAEGHPIVNPMHTASGLWEDLETKQAWGRVHVDNYITGWLKEQRIPAGTMALSGSSVGSLDRPFIQRHFPGLNIFLSYRNIDISSIKELVKMHKPEIYTKMEIKLGSKDDATHRALDDCKASIREYQFYMEEGFINVE